jgi:hypothetical protein
MMISSLSHFYIFIFIFTPTNIFLGERDRCSSSGQPRDRGSAGAPHHFLGKGHRGVVYAYRNMRNGQLRSVKFEKVSLRRGYRQSRPNGRSVRIRWRWRCPLTLRAVATCVSLHVRLPTCASPYMCVPTCAYGSVTPSSI